MLPAVQLSAAQPILPFLMSSKLKSFLMPGFNEWLYSQPDTRWSYIESLGNMSDNAQKLLLKASNGVGYDVKNQCTSPGGAAITLLISEQTKQLIVVEPSLFVLPRVMGQPQLQLTERHEYYLTY